MSITAPVDTMHKLLLRAIPSGVVEQLKRAASKDSSSMHTEDWDRDRCCGECFKPLTVPLLRRQCKSCGRRFCVTHKMYRQQIVGRNGVHSVCAACHAHAHDAEGMEDDHAAAGGLLEVDDYGHAYASCMQDAKQRRYGQQSLTAWGQSEQGENGDDDGASFDPFAEMGLEKSQCNGFGVRPPTPTHQASHTHSIEATARDNVYEVAQARGERPQPQVFFPYEADSTQEESSPHATNATRGDVCGAFDGHINTNAAGNTHAHAHAHAHTRARTCAPRTRGGGRRGVVHGASTAEWVKQYLQ